MAKPKEPTVAEILARVPARKPKSKIEAWLAADAKRTAKFWAVIDEGTADGDRGLRRVEWMGPGRVPARRAALHDAPHRHDEAVDDAADLGAVMPRARNRAQRAIQVLRWIDANWTIGRPIELRWKPELIDEDGKKCDGWTDRVGRGLLIELSEKRNRTVRDTTDTVIHEATHALQWPVAGKAEHDRHHHPPAFWAQYGEIRDRFDHDGGHEDAGEFGWE